MSVYDSSGGSPFGRPPVRAGTLWAGGVAAALVAGGVAVVGFLLVRGVLDLPMLGRGAGRGGLRAVHAHLRRAGRPRRHRRHRADAPAAGHDAAPAAVLRLDRRPGHGGRHDRAVHAEPAVPRRRGHRRREPLHRTLDRGAGVDERPLVRTAGPSGPALPRPARSAARADPASPKITATVVSCPLRTRDGGNAFNSRGDLAARHLDGAGRTKPADPCEAAR